MGASRLFAPGFFRTFGLGICCIGGSFACVEPENPCDPQSERTVRQTASLSGIVLDQDEHPVAGVTVLVNEASKTTVSAEDGTFTIVDLLPNAGEEGYEVSAVPMPPLLGGVVRVDPVGCREELTDIQLRVARPPASPATDWVQATSDERLLVGFPSVVGNDKNEQANAYRYQVELRVPFGTWSKALITCDSHAAATPWDEIDPEADAYGTRVSDACAQHLCMDYVNGAPILDTATARCAQVVGVADATSPSGFAPLETHGSYLVRVVSERSSDADITSQRLPAILSSADTNSPTDVSLLPTSWSEVPLAPDLDAHNERSAELDVECIFGFEQGRFAMLDPGGAQGGVRMLSFAESVADYEGNDAVPEDALVYAEADTQSTGEELASEPGQPLAILAHGNTMRILKRMHGENAGVKIEKVSLGAGSTPVDGSRFEPRFHWDFSHLNFRGLKWLDQYDTTHAGNPPDAYILLFKRGFLLVERESAWHEDGSLLANNFDRLNRFAQYFDVSLTELNLPGFSAGLCGDLQEPGGQSLDAEGGNIRTTRVCVNLSRLTGDAVDLHALEVLSAAEDESDPAETVHVFSDAANDRVLVFLSDALLGNADVSLSAAMHEVSVGRNPMKMMKSRILSCEEGADAPQPVLLVANQDSQDISILTLSDATTRKVIEGNRISLPAPPRAFLEDEQGPDCGSPFSWVILSDGRVVPIDMRRGEITLPSCGDEPCAIQVPGKRLQTGAINRDADGRPRMVFGGRQVLGEVGFLRRGHRTHFGE